NFLLLRNQALDKGSFVVNGKTIVPLENPDNSLFLLAVNSQNISMSACFELTKDRKKEDIKNIQQELIALRDLPLNTNNDKLAKLDKIFTILEQHQAAYVLINKGNDINKSNLNLIELVLVDHSSDLTIITLDSKDSVKQVNAEQDELDPIRKTNVQPNQPVSANPISREEQPVLAKQPVYVEPVEEDPSFYDYIEIGGEHPGIFRHVTKKPKKEKKLFNFESKPKQPTTLKQKEEKPKQRFSNDEKIAFDFNYIKKLMKKEWSSFLFVVYGALSTVFFALVTPFQFAYNKANILLPVIFLVGSLLCFLVSVLIIASLYAFMDKEVISKKRYVYTTAFTEIFTIMGVILAFVLLVVLKKVGILIDESVDKPYKSSFVIVGIIFTLLIVVTPFIVKYLRQFGNKIKSIFKKE
ncbi:MAG: hypothetical protein MJ248_04430, partial [Bacilli bacterium]|nr:hypothetical protein [Bacilli bacterium]